LDQRTILFNEHWDTWCDLRLEDKLPPDQHAYARTMVERMILCRDPKGGYVRYVCPGCGLDRRVPFSSKTRLWQGPRRLTDYDAQRIIYWYIDCNSASASQSPDLFGDAGFLLAILCMLDGTKGEAKENNADLPGRDSQCTILL
jgi:hypothetical protein